MPLLTELSSWRSKLTEIEKKFQIDHKDFDLTFVADFYGLKVCFNIIINKYFFNV